MFINTYQQTVNFITLFRFLMDHQNMYTDRHVIEMLAMKHRILFQAAICLKLKRDFFFVLYLLMIDLSLRRKCGKSIHCLMFVYHLGVFIKDFLLSLTISELNCPISTSYLPTFFAYAFAQVWRNSIRKLLRIRTLFQYKIIRFYHELKLSLLRSINCICFLTVFNPFN